MQLANVLCAGKHIEVQPDHRRKQVSNQDPDPNLTAYWRENIRYVLILLVIWFVVSYGCALLFVDQLNQFRLLGFPLGFWFGQQGGMFFFVILIFVYVWLMNRLDKKYNVRED